MRLSDDSLVTETFKGPSALAALYTFITPPPPIDMIFPLSFLLVGAAFASALPDPTSVLNDLDCESGSDLVAASWYAGWHSADVPLSGVSWDKYTHMTYAFA